MKRAICFVLSSLLLFIPLVGCGTRKQPTTNSTLVTSKNTSDQLKVNIDNQKKSLLIACIVNQDDQYMRILQLGMEDAADKAGVNVILANAYNKLDKEIELINTYIENEVDGICVHPVSVDLSVPMLKKAQDRGIKVISSGIKIQDSYNIGYIESDQWELGKKTGIACRDFILKKLGGKANIAILNYDSQFPEESSKRTDGFLTEVTKLPGVKIVTKQEAWLADIAVSKVRDVINSYPSINIIWAANEGGTVGATIAVKNTEKTGKIFVFGTDVNQQLLNQLLSKENILQAITGQQPYEIGYQSMEQLINDIRYEQTNKKIIIPGVSLSRTNQRSLRAYILKFNKMIGAH